MKDKEQASNLDVNPIDKDKVTENPGLLPYAHTVGGAQIKPIDRGKVKGRAMMAMQEQTEMQMDQIKQQIELLAEQAQAIHKRIEISRKIYEAAVGFEPLISHVYHLYEKKDGSWLLSLVGPQEWGGNHPFAAFVGTVKLLADHTWDLKGEDQNLEDLDMPSH
jgi:hypothetical protein